MRVCYIRREIRWRERESRLGSAFDKGQLHRIEATD